jgi:mRNA-degrading endonuclease RelE of RelBE toxin-antitoxin system
LDNAQQYKLKLTSASQKDVDKLPTKIKIEILTRHFTKLKLDPKIYSKRLHGELKGFYSYHFGHHPEYRILFTVIADEVIILMIAKRENFYKEAYRRLL